MAVPGPAYDNNDGLFLDQNNPTFIWNSNNINNSNYMGNIIYPKSDSVLNDSDSALLLTDMDNEGYDSNGRRISLTMSQDGDTEMNERRTDHCHAPVSGEDVLAKNQLIAVSCFCFLFMVAEIVGGTLANSLAIATDATHLACDLTGFLISLFSIWIAKKPPSRKLSFGYYRAEVIGALCSILLIWVVTVILVAMAVKRIQNNEFEVGGQPMIITASLGVIFNIIMGVVLHSGLCKSCSNIKTSFGHGHSHGGHGDHGHSHGGQGHSHGDHGHSHRGDGGHGHSHGGHGSRGHSHGGHGGHGHSHGDHGHSHDLQNCTTSLNTSVNASNTAVQNGVCQVSVNSFARDEQLIMSDEVEDDCIPVAATSEDGAAEEQQQTRLSFKGSTNINVRAAFIHVVGDLIQSIGVFVAAIIIMIKPEYKLADPICTFIFSFLVLCTTLTVLGDVGNIIMEGVPRSINYSSVKQSLSSLPGVISVHSLNIWSLTVDKIALNVHLAIAEDTTDWRKVLQTSVQLLRTQYNIDHPTVQVEPYNDLDMRDCIRCLHP